MLGFFAQAPDVLEESSKKVVVTIIVAAVTTAASFLFGRYYGRYRAGREWHRKEFLGRVIVSLNILHDGTLKIRTVLERSLEEIFLNQLAVKKSPRRRRPRRSTTRSCRSRRRTGGSCSTSC